MAPMRSRNPRRRRLRRGIRWGLAAFVIVLLLLYLVVPELEGASHQLSLISQVNVAYLLAGVLLEAASLIAYAQLTRTVLPPGGPSRGRILQINMSSLAMSHVMPGGTAPGTALTYRLLTQNDVSPPDAGFAIAMQGVGSAVVLNLIFWLALIISLFFHAYNPLYSVAAGAGVLMMGLFAAVVVMLTRGRRWSLETVRHLAQRVPFLDADKLADALQRVAQRLNSLSADRRLMLRAMGWAAANWLLDAASLWVFVAAFHVILSPVDLLVAYGLANILAVIPITPGGLGVVEGVLIPTLVGFGVHKAVATFAVLGWRLINFWLPIPLGGGSYLGLRFTSLGWRERISTVHGEIVEHSLPVVTPEHDAAARGAAARGAATNDAGGDHPAARHDGSGRDGRHDKDEPAMGVGGEDADKDAAESSSVTPSGHWGILRRYHPTLHSRSESSGRLRSDPGHEAL